MISQIFIFYTLIMYLYLLTRFESQLEMRFSEKNKELFKIFEIFDYSSPYYFNTKGPYLKFFIEHYKHFQINIINLSSEFNSAKSLLKNKDILKPDLYSIMNTLTLHSGAFIETIKILHIIITLPISTASNERFFSSLKRLKSYIRTTMSVLKGCTRSRRTSICVCVFICARTATYT